MTASSRHPLRTGPARRTLLAAAVAAALGVPALGAQAAPPADTRSFIVMLQDQTPSPGVRAAQLVAPFTGARIQHTYTHAIKGFAVSVPEAAADRFVSAMRNQRDVRLVEPDGPMWVTQTIQTSATWGLDRTDQASLPLSGTYSYLDTGSSVHAYVIDTGILATHTDFGGRVSGGFNAINDGRGTRDCNGHGTHVAGTIGGARWGMAKAVRLVPVRVLDCRGSGTTSGVIAGIDWVTANATRPAVANMSLGGGISTSLDTAVAKAVTSGITMVVAAGNSNADACNASPARAPSAITVGATTSTDARASYSNFGTCVDIFAPGSSITSAWHSSDTATSTISGTSMAAPHVAGLAALLLHRAPASTPAQIVDAIRSSATAGVVGNAGTGSPNLLLYSDTQAPVTVATNPDPSGTGNEPVGTSDVVVKASVGSLAGAATIVNKNTWRATVSVSVKNSDGAPLANAIVQGNFTGAGTQTCTTDESANACTIAANVPSKTASVTFNVTGIAGTNISYDAAGNTATSVTIMRP